MVRLHIYKRMALRMSRRGLSNAEIHDLLGISERSMYTGISELEIETPP